MIADGVSIVTMCPIPTSKPERIIIELQIKTCCCCETPDVIDPDVVQTVPQSIALKGVDSGTWTQWMTRLRDMLKSKQMGSCISQFMIQCVLTIPCFILRNNSKQKAMRKFCEEMNAQVLEPRGMYLKSQYGVVGRGSQEIAVAILSIAMTPDEIEQLKKESHVLKYMPGTNTFVSVPMGDKINAKYCCGVTQVMAIM